MKCANKVNCKRFTVGSHTLGPDGVSVFILGNQDKCMKIQITEVQMLLITVLWRPENCVQSLAFQKSIIFRLTATGNGITGASMQ